MRRLRELMGVEVATGEGFEEESLEIVLSHLAKSLKAEEALVSKWIEKLKAAGIKDISGTRSLDVARVVEIGLPSALGRRLLEYNTASLSTFSADSDQTRRPCLLALLHTSQSTQKKRPVPKSDEASADEAPTKTARSAN
mmetsp:Transcript_45321/g.106981  ORF Transcript_45321/g.106981 Transcript_45321/m.106981 type:complete len:140 (+) Transcript_45321:627-1046(+)